MFTRTTQTRRVYDGTAVFDRDRVMSCAPSSALSTIRTDSVFVNRRFHHPIPLANKNAPTAVAKMATDKNETNRTKRTVHEGHVRTRRQRQRVNFIQQRTFRVLCVGPGHAEPGMMTRPFPIIRRR